MKKPGRKAGDLKLTLWAALCFALVHCAPVAYAQGAAPSVPVEPNWQSGVEIKKSPAPLQKPKNTTVIERDLSSGATSEAGTKLVALLAADGQQIDQGLVWRIYQAQPQGGKAKLVSEMRDPAPSLKLPPGDYTVNAAFGRANLTRKISIKGGEPQIEQFVLNAGGLRVNPVLNGKPLPAGNVTYAIYSDDRDQLSNRTAVMTAAKPGMIIRLNAGIYRIISTYGDANAKVEADVTVEAGKMTETSLSHSAGTVTLKLVAKPGGDALPETSWSIQNKDGETIKESVGALPSHIVAPGNYIALARSGGRTYRSAFTVKNSEMTAVEVVQTDDNAVNDSETIQPSLEIKSP